MDKQPMSEDLLDSPPGGRLGAESERAEPSIARGRASTDPEGRSAEEIEDDIERTRSQMDDTLSALQRKLSPEHLGDEVMRYLRNGGATEFMRNFGESVKRNPVPVSLVGVGLAWLMASGRQGQYAPHNAPSGGGEHHLGERLSGAVSRVSGAASSAASATRNRLSGAAQRASEVAASGRERLSQGSGRMSSAGGHLRERGAHVRGRASALGGSAREQAGSAYESLREQPLLLGALGIAMGAALGALLPPTRQEDEWIGPLRDPVIDRAREEVSGQLDKGKKIAQAAGEAAKNEAGRSDSSRSEAARPPGGDGSPRGGDETRPMPGL